MTSNSVKIRSLFLSALMVFSVFAGTVALAGSAAAAQAGNNPGEPRIVDATHYDADASDASIDSQIEIEFNESIDVASVTDGDTDIEIRTEDSSTPVTIDGTTATFRDGNTGDRATLYLELGTSSANLFPQVSNITITNFEDDNGDSRDSFEQDVNYGSSEVDTDFDNTDNGESDATFQAYRGENVTIYSGTSSPVTFDIDSEDGDVSRTVGTGPNSEVFVYETEDADLGDYYVTTTSGTVGFEENVTLQVEELGLEVEADEESFDDNENVNATISANDVSRSVEYEVLDSSGDIVDGTEDSDTTSPTDGTLDVNFGELDADENYTVRVNDTDTGISVTSDSFNVVDVGDEEADFANASYQEARGDIVNITVQFDNTDTATVQVGDEEDDNYYAVAEVVDDDEDGIAYVEFNSFYAGSGNPNTVLSTNTDDELSDVDEGGDFVSAGGNNLGEDVLAASDYDILVRSGEKTDANPISNEDSIATLTLSEQSTDAVNLWTAPEDDFSSLSDTDAAGITEFVEAGNLTQSGAIAEGDALVIEVTANGLEGAVQAGPDGAVSTATYQSLLNQNFDVDTDGDGNADAYSPIGDQFINLTIEEDSAAANANPEIANLSAADTANMSVIYADNEGAGADAHYVILNSENVTELSGDFNHEDEDSYVANFTMWDESAVGTSDLSDENVSVSDDIEVQDPEIEVDSNENDFVVLEAADGQEVTGDTNFAPGTELTIRVRSDGAPVPFLEQPETVVQSDGTFTAVANFSAENEGANFTITARGSNNGFTASDVDGYLVEATEEPTTETATEDGTAVTETEEPTAPPTDTEEPTTEEETTTMGEMTEEETTEMAGTDTAAEETTTGAGGPGFTAVVALIALVAAALLAVRRDN